VSEATAGGAVAFAVIAAPWGPIHIAATERGIAAIELMTPTERFIASLESRLHRAVEPARFASGAARELVEHAVAEVEAYLGGSRTAFDLAIDPGPRPAWDAAVFDGVRRVRWGEVTSYGRLARRIGRPGAARAVGGAVGRNPIALVVPCHRVIAGDGSIGGYGGAWWGTADEMLAVKRTLLQLEGIELPVRFGDRERATSANARHLLTDG
jgi:methylated-DNA-[protein]-cysteine S-methyltransferase